MPELFDAYPRLEGEKIVIRMMEEGDVDMLAEITSNPNVYKHISNFLFNKSRNTLLTAIRNLRGRDFEKKKLIIAGVYLKNEPGRLVGLAEMFDYKKRADKITVGYRINESYWRQGIATEIVALVSRYLTEDIGIGTLEAEVIPENLGSSRALIKNGFVKEPELRAVSGWGGQETSQVEVYTYRKA